MLVQENLVRLNERGIRVWRWQALSRTSGCARSVSLSDVETFAFTFECGPNVKRGARIPKNQQLSDLLRCEERFFPAFPILPSVTGVARPSFPLFVVCPVLAKLCI